MAVQYLTGFHGEDPSPLSERATARREVHRWLQRERDYRVRRRGDHDWSQVRNGKDTADRVDQILPNLGVGDVLLIQNVRTKRTFAIRVAEVGVKPANTAGRPALDLIVGFVYSEFDDQYGITNLGLCVKKDGNHGCCGAWDCGVSKPSSADAIHRAIRDIADGIRSNSWSHGLGLETNGIIVMSEICQRSGDFMTGWSPYHGTPHVSHAHVSDWPACDPGWV